MKRPDDPPLLVQLMERLNADPQTFVVEEIMIPVVECWAKVARERGVLLESHAQNLLLEIDQNFRPCRIVHRDCDVWVDRELRIDAGLESPFERSCIDGDMRFPREQHYSLVYDHFIGRELLDYLLKLLTRFYGGDEGTVRHRVATAFHHCFPDAHEFLPAGTTYYFSNEILPGNEFRLVDMNRAPEWR